jgi:type II secretory pathway pseudopilin PulG
MRGWSLMELVLVIVILGTLGVFVGPLLLNAVTAYDKTHASVVTLAKQRYAMERMVREIRDIRRTPADTASFDISVFTATGLTFFKTDGTEVALALSGSNVTLGYTGTATATLTDQVGGLSLAYYLQDGTTTAGVTAANMAFVEVSLTLLEGGASFANRSRVDLRNPQ